MIFSTLNQANLVLIISFCGIISGFIFHVFSTLLLKNFQKNLIKNIINAIFYTFLCVFYVFLINFLNFGKFSYTLLFAYVGGILLIYYQIKKPLEIFETMWYNKINKFISYKKANKKEKPKKRRLKQYGTSKKS